MLKIMFGLCFKIALTNCALRKSFSTHSVSPIQVAFVGHYFSKSSLNIFFHFSISDFLFSSGYALRIPIVRMK